jgi:predicted DsbA family dithiol-disulfide isomerase
MNPNLSRTQGTADARSLATLKIDVIADLVCPWSWLGKRRLDDALLAVHGPSQVSWYPFLVNRGTTAVTFSDYVKSRFGDPGYAELRLEELRRAGKAEGLDFRFDRLTALPATVDAHGLLKLAEAEGAGVSAVAEHLFRGFLEEALDLADREVLLELGRRAGLSAASIRRVLDDEATRMLVLSQDAQIRKSGLTAVPNFLVNKRLFVIGAQTTEALVSVFDRAMFGGESDRPVSSVLH